MAMRQQLDFSVEEKHLKRFRTNFGLASPPIPDGLLPLKNRFRPNKGEEPLAAVSQDADSQRQLKNVVGSLPLKFLGMRRQVSFPYPFEALSSGEVLVMTLEEGLTLSQLFKTRNQLQEAKQRFLNNGASIANTAHEEVGGSTQARHSGIPLGSPGAVKMIEVSAPCRLLSNSKEETESTDSTKSTQGARKFSLLSLYVIKPQRFPDIGMICLHSFLQMVFLDNFFHSDMHSGNLICRFARNSKEVRRSRLYGRFPSSI